jgi:DNA repair photolyase
MRWDDLRVERGEKEARLPGFKEPAVVRTFDAPEAMGIRFLEVLARSGINQVPKRSRMPFRYTINPYRGCTHACSYCVQEDTPILMGDGRTKPIAEVRVGDRIYGTVPNGSYRRFVITNVVAHWETRKPAYRITLEDGTELVASGDHRFLTDRGWKHVIGTEWGGPLQRPHLTLNNKLMGTGKFAGGPEDSGDYRRGYLCGLIRGDGHVGSYQYERPERANGDVHRFRLALTDIEALRRARDYLLEVDVATDEFLFQEAGAVGRSKPVRAIRTSARDKVTRVAEVIRWPRTGNDAWCKGFLAGIFDAEGSRSSGNLRISNTDMAIIDWTTWCLRRLGFDSVVEDPRRSNGLKVVRVPGGLRQHLRLFHTVDPAISRKRFFGGTAIKSDAKLRVVSIEPLGKGRPMFDITTGTGDFIANGVVSHNCFARPSHTYLDFNAREDFERQIVVKVNVPELVRAELARPSWKGDHVALGTNTDPYQWVEGRYRLMKGIWEAMRDAANPCSVLTKSPLLLRDLPLFEQLVERTEFSTALSVPTLDERAWRETEPHTPHPRKRLEAVAELTRAGVPCSVLIAPLIPGVNDAPEQVDEILELAGEAGATNVTGIGLHLRGEVRDIWFDWLRQYRPDLVPRYEKLYERGAYLPAKEKRRLGELTKPFRRKPGALRWRSRRKNPPERISREGAAKSPRSPQPASRQSRLF